MNHESEQLGASRLMVEANAARVAGQLLTCQQRLAKSLELLETARDEESLRLKAKAYILMANVLVDVGRFREAEQAYAKAADIYRQGLNDRRGESFVLHGLANLHFSAGELERARQCFEESLSIKKELSSCPEDVFPSLYGLGRLLLTLGELDAAHDIIAQCQRISPSPNEPRIDELLADYLAHKGAWAEVIPVLERLRENVRGSPDVSSYVLAEMGLARAYHETDEPEASDAHFWSFLEAIEQRLGTHLATADRDGMRSRYLAALDEQFRMWSKQGGATHEAEYKILEAIERLAAWDLRSRLGVAQESCRIGAREFSLLEDGELLVYLFGTAAVLHTVLVTNQGIICADASAFANRWVFEGLDGFDFLSDDFDEHEPKSAAAVATVAATVLMICTIKKHVRKICFAFPFGRAMNVPWEFFVENSEHFSRKPEWRLPSATAVSRLPSYSLYRTLSHKHRQCSGDVAPPVVLAHPVGPFEALPDTLKEVEVIRQLFPGARAMTGRHACPESTIALVRPRFLHIACHGSFDASNPMRSYLQLSPPRLTPEQEVAWRKWQGALSDFLNERFEGYVNADERDFNRDYPTPYAGELFAESLLHCDLRGTEFVFLGACFGGRVSTYEDVEGFSQAVFLAGCPNVLAPLWAVDTEAAEVFAVTFYTEYRHLLRLAISEGGKVAKAAALARLAVLRGGFGAAQAAAWTLCGIG